MTMHSRALLHTCALVLAGGIAAAQAGIPAGTPGGPRPRPPIDTTLDANGDEIIDAGEIANALAALQKLDANGDGQLTPDEYRPPRPGTGAGGTTGGGPEIPSGQNGPPQGTNGMAGGSQTRRRPLPPIVTALDTDGDGMIGADEIANAITALATLDANGDGALSPDEYRPPRPGRPNTPEGMDAPLRGQSEPGH